MSAAVWPRDGWRRHQALGAGAILLALFGLVALADPSAALRAWYAAVLFWTGIPLGALALLLMHQLTGGRWGRYLQPLLRAAVATLPWLLVAYLPLLLGMERLFPWVVAPELLPDVVQRKLAWLNPPFFLLRTAITFAIWLALARAVAAGRSSTALAVAGLILYVLSLTFFGVDWVQSLAPTFYSSAIGYVLGTGQFVAILAFAIAAATTLDLRASDGGEPPLPDLGNLLLAAVMLWTYILYMEFLIIWSGNLPHEIGWYLARQRGPWGWLTVLLVVGHFALPFAALLFRRLKRSRRWLGRLAALVLAAHALAVCWLILPSFEGLSRWTTPAVLLGIAGLGALWFHRFHGYLTELLARETPLAPQQAHGHPARAGRNEDDGDG